MLIVLPVGSGLMLCMVSVQTVISKVMNLLIRELAKPTSVLSVAGFIRSSSTSYCDWLSSVVCITIFGEPKGSKKKH